MCIRDRQYGELYHTNYYKEVKEKNRVYYEYYCLDRTEEVPADYKEISFVCLRPVSYTHLDVYKRQVLGLLKHTSGEFNQTIVMITHNNEIAQLADRIVRIEDGKIVG